MVFAYNWVAESCVDSGICRKENKDVLSTICSCRPSFPSVQIIFFPERKQQKRIEIKFQGLAGFVPAGPFSPSLPKSPPPPQYFFSIHSAYKNSSNCLIWYREKFGKRERKKRGKYHLKPAKTRDYQHPPLPISSLYFLHKKMALEALSYREKDGDKRKKRGDRYSGNGAGEKEEDPSSHPLPLIPSFLWNQRKHWHFCTPSCQYISAQSLLASAFLHYAFCITGGIWGLSLMQRVMGRKGGGEGPKTSENRGLSAFSPPLLSLSSKAGEQGIFGKRGGGGEGGDGELLFGSNFLSE